MNIITADEVHVIAMSLQQTIDDLETTSKDPTIHFTPEARRDMRVMLELARSAKVKLEKTTGHEIRMEKYKEGDENRFLTKES